jgi:hypothetical protein
MSFNSMTCCFPCEDLSHAIQVRLSFNPYEKQHVTVFLGLVTRGEFVQQESSICVCSRRCGAGVASNKRATSDAHVLNPKALTTDPAPSTLHSQPYTLNPQPSTRKP